MDRTELLILILSALLLLRLVWEAVTARQDRKALQHVVYVNGTRGKSTVTRMIAAGLTAGGHWVLCKTTGTLPIAIHPDGRQELIERKAPANIREQLVYLHKAAKEKADVLVIECMALQPEYQRVSGRDMLRCDVGVITNARLDHMDVMGDTREEILDCLMEMLPENGLIFTAERDFPQQMNARALDMVRLCREMEPKEIWLLGDEQRALSRQCRRAAPRATVRGFRAAEEIPFDSDRPRLILAVGNIKNEGMRLMERAKNELKELPVRGGEGEHV